MPEEKHHSDGKKLNYARRALKDHDLEELPIRSVNYPYQEVDFSQNALSVTGLRRVVDLCKRCDKLRVLKLFKNDIDDHGAEVLGGFLKHCETIEELHLSHNRFTERGVESIVRNAAHARQKGMNPLWLRLEQNCVSNPEAASRDLSNKYNVCFRKDRNRCTVRHCVKGSKVHLPHFHFQREEAGGPGKGRGRRAGGKGDEWDDWDGGDGDWDWKGNKDAAWTREGSWDREWDKGRGKKRRRGEDDNDSRAGSQRPRRQVRSRSRETPEKKRPRMKTSGTFLRALGALGDGHSTVAIGKKREMPQGGNVALGTLSRMGILKQGEKRAGITLKEGPSAIKGEMRDAELGEEDVSADAPSESEDGDVSSAETEDPRAPGRGPVQLSKREDPPKIVKKEAETFELVSSKSASPSPAGVSPPPGDLKSPSPQVRRTAAGPGGQTSRRVRQASQSPRAGRAKVSARSPRRDRHLNQGRDRDQDRRRHRDNRAGAARRSRSPQSRDRRRRDRERDQGERRSRGRRREHHDRPRRRERERPAVQEEAERPGVRRGNRAQRAERAGREADRGSSRGDRRRDRQESKERRAAGQATRERVTEKEDLRHRDGRASGVDEITGQVVAARPKAAPKRQAMAATAAAQAAASTASKAPPGQTARSAAKATAQAKEAGKAVNAVSLSDEQSEYTYSYTSAEEEEEEEEDDSPVVVKP